MKILHTGCWHLGHRRTPTNHISINIQKYLFPKLEEIDILILAGDIFDAACSVDSSEIVYISELFAELTKRCKKHNVIIRLLRGTYSHDKSQLNYLFSLIKSYGLEDVQLYSNIAVEYIEKHDIYLGYVPDNTQCILTDSVINKLKEKMNVFGINQVNYLITHGVYDVLQLPIQYGLVLVLDKLQKLTKNRILSGHIHQSQVHDKLIYAGSIDRLDHGEEDDKGYWIIDHDTNSCTFINNPNAYPYLTISLLNNELNTDNIIQYILSNGSLMEILDQHNEGHVRFRIKKQDLITLKPYITSFFNENYPNIILVYTSYKTDIEEKEEVINITQEIKQLEQLNEKTLPKIIHNRLLQKDIDIDLKDIKEMLQ